MGASHEHRQLAQVDRYIAEAKVHISQQRALVRRLTEAAQSTELAESMLETLEGNLLAFERHRKFILSHMKAAIK